MCFRFFGPFGLAALVAAAFVGCKKAPPPAVETVARVHWLGGQQLPTGTNGFFKLRQLPESEQLGRQTLDKLALAPWRLLKGDPATNGAPVAQLRPLLDDLVQAESYLEIRAAGDRPGDLVLAIRLGAARAALWETNLAAVMESLTGVKPASAPNGRPGWALQQTAGPKTIELTRAGDWTLVGMTWESTALLGDFAARIQSVGVPYAARTTNFWFETALDLRRMSRALALDWRLPAGLPQLAATMAGDGEAVLTRGTFEFAEPQSFEFEPWNIPTNLVHDPLTSFTAIRGLKTWLASAKWWSDLQLGPPPGQVSIWAVEGMPAQHYFAAPLPDATNRVELAAGRLLDRGNPWLATNAIGEFVRDTNAAGVLWIGPPFIAPSLRPVVETGGNFVLGGLFLNTTTNLPIPEGLLPALESRENLIAYDWELTGPRLEDWIYTGQLLRMLLNKAQLPPESASVKWFKAAAPELGNCTTALTQSGPRQLAFVRRSPAGFSAVELHWLADWLESPQFPRGLHTLLAPLPPEFQPQPSANQ